MYSSMRIYELKEARTSKKINAMCIACRRKWRNHHDIYNCEEIGRPVMWKLRGYSDSQL